MRRKEIEAQIREEAADAIAFDLQAVRDEFLEALQDEVDAALGAEWRALEGARRAELAEPLFEQAAADLGGGGDILSLPEESYRETVREIYEQTDAALGEERAAFMKARRPEILRRLMAERAGRLEEMLEPVREAWEDLIRIAIDERLAEEAAAARQQ